MYFLLVFDLCCPLAAWGQSNDVHDELEIDLGSEFADQHLAQGPGGGGMGAQGGGNSGGY